MTSMIVHHYYLLLLLAKVNRENIWPSVSENNRADRFSSLGASLGVTFKYLLSQMW